MASKATAVLLRLKEMDKKYKSKSMDNNKLLSESSNDNSDSHKMLRPTLNIQMPETHVEDLGDYSLNNQRELATLVKVVDEIIVSSNIDSKLEEKSRVTDMHSTEASDIEEVITESFISEVLDESKELIDKNSTKIDENFLSTVESIESRENTSDFNPSVLSKDGEAIETYSKDSFESNSSFDDESQVTKNETVESCTSTPLTNNVNCSEEAELTEKIAKDSVSVPHISENNFINKNDDGNIEIEFLSEKNEDSAGKIQNEGSDSDVTSNSQNRTNKSLISMEATYTKGSLVQSVESNIHDESKVKTEVKVENKKLDAIGESNGMKASVVSSKSKNFGNIPEINYEKTCNGRDEIEMKTDQSQKCIADSVHWRISRKGRKRKTRKNQQIRMDHSRIPSPVIQYLKRLDEENRHSSLIPSRLIFPEVAGVTGIRPLEFPKISQFIRSKSREQESNDPTIAFLRSRLAEIHKWLEDQYILYREHCDLAVSINHNYEPVTIENTKKIIYHLRKEMKLKK